MANTCREEVSKTFPEAVSLGSTEMLQGQVRWPGREVRGGQVLIVGAPTAALRGRRGKGERSAAGMQSLGERRKTNRAPV